MPLQLANLHLEFELSVSRLLFGCFLSHYTLCMAELLLDCPSCSLNVPSWLPHCFMHCYGAVSCAAEILKPSLGGNTTYFCCFVHALYVTSCIDAVLHFFRIFFDFIYHLFPRSTRLHYQAATSVIELGLNRLCWIEPVMLD